MFQITVWTFLRAGKLYITDRRGPSTNVGYFHYHSGLDYCCFVDSTCHQPVMAASSLQELAAMRNLTTCELDKRRHLVTDVRNRKPYLGQDVKVCDKYLGQCHIKVKRSKCQRSGMNARLPLLPVTGHPMTASRRCHVTIRGCQMSSPLSDLVTDVRTSKRHMASSTCLVTMCRF